MSSDLSEKNKKIFVHINRDPNSSFDFTGAENEARPRAAAMAGRVAAINRIRRTGTGMAKTGVSKINGAPLKSLPSAKSVGNNNFKLNF